MPQSAVPLTAVQAKINGLGLQPPLAVDGKWGPKTAAGVSWARTKLGLLPGELDDALIAKLGLSQRPSPAGGEFASLVGFAQKYSQSIIQAPGVADGFTATRASVVDSFVPWSAPFEGVLPFMYTDAKGLVTSGMGNLVDPKSLALGLPWKKADGSLASQAEISAEWDRIKAAYPAIQSNGSGKIATLHLDKSEVAALVRAKLRLNDAYLAAHLPGFASAPADAQLAAHSMAWAMGPGFAASWTNFRGAFGGGDFKTAASESHMQGVGIDMRNLANKLLLLNASAVSALKLDPDHLYYVDGLALLDKSGALAVPRAVLSRLPMLTRQPWLLDASFIAGGAMVGLWIAGPPGMAMSALLCGAVDLYLRLKGR
jgi:hypothetical protein